MGINADAGPGSVEILMDGMGWLTSRTFQLPSATRPESGHSLASAKTPQAKRQSADLREGKSQSRAKSHSARDSRASAARSVLADGFIGVFERDGAGQ